MALFAITRTYFSTSDAETDGHTDVVVFEQKEDAHRYFNQLKQDELGLRCGSGTGYSIVRNADNQFYCKWDVDREAASISMVSLEKEMCP